MIGLDIIPENAAFFYSIHFKGLGMDLFEHNQQGMQRRKQDAFRHQAGIAQRG
jgi:hypothetical protein